LDSGISPGSLGWMTLKLANLGNQQTRTKNKKSTDKEEENAILEGRIHVSESKIQTRNSISRNLMRAANMRVSRTVVCAKKRSSVEAGRNTK